MSGWYSLAGGLGVVDGVLGSSGLVAAAGLLADDLDALLGRDDTNGLVVDETSVL